MLINLKNRVCYMGEQIKYRLGECAMNEILKEVLEVISLAIGIAATVIIIWGSVLAIVEFAKIKTKKGYIAEESDGNLSLSTVRQNLGVHLLLGLEFLIAADIVETVVNPSLNEITLLGGIVVIRTVISYFLGKELKDKLE